MKKQNILSRFFIACFILGTLVASGQAISRDSSRAVGMKNMQLLLKLTDQQVKEITALTIAQEKKVDQMKRAPMMPEIRKQQMENDYSAYRKAIRKILTKEQWEQYEQIQAQRRSKMVEEGTKNKVKVQLGRIKE
eukprot:TRINITY_DN28286_c0_g1_i1.p1 TRINITY_DN28286_c0_g1~~TRINITY_DN28286_c0_g1_i1.p1  ORF type:complete len:135 (-),score=9.43 TRINITY_DN28286_c0_g1_i1:2-406(-)